MNQISDQQWLTFNQKQLDAHLSRIQILLQNHLDNKDEKRSIPDLPVSEEQNSSTVDIVCAKFGLSDFERDILLLAVGMELESSIAVSIGKAQSGKLLYPTFSLALTLFASSYWSALIPDAPLRKWRLIELGEGETLITRRIFIPERVLHFLTGLSVGEEMLDGMIEVIPSPGMMPVSHQKITEQILGLWKQNSPALQPIQLYGRDSQGKKAIAAQAAAEMGLKLTLIHGNYIPIAAQEREALARLWNREFILGESALLINLENVEEQLEKSVRYFIKSLVSPCFLICREPVYSEGMLRLEVNKPKAVEQYDYWKQLMDQDKTDLNNHLGTISSQFDLSFDDIQTAVAKAVNVDKDENEFGRTLWNSCREQSRISMGNLAEPIECSTTWNQLVLPEPQKNYLKNIAKHVKHRLKVYEDWGFAKQNSRGLGISALFAGPSGTGKTMAAEILAVELDLDLYRIDLSAVVSKYIGETEKNLRKIFDAAENGGSLLLFDEADALFGKRSEVKDSHDRHANIEVSYLLQRMESYKGLAILTTNFKSAIDSAFMRRIRFIVHFPFPDASRRAEIWKSIFPPETPKESLEVNQLSRLNITGGNIRNIAMSAAFIAADHDEAVTMDHIFQAAKNEYLKLEKTISGAEFGKWA